MFPPGIRSLVFGLAFLFVSSCATRSEFDRLYDHYFPKRSDYVDSVYRKSFDKTLFGPAPTEGMSPRMTLLYRAFHGDGSAFHSFVRHPDRDAGHAGEEWASECVLLLVKLGDNRFAQLLAQEDRDTREMVGQAIDPRMNFKKHGFSKTRALYHFRWGPHKPQS